MADFRDIRRKFFSLSPNWVALGTKWNFNKKNCSPICELQNKGLTVTSKTLDVVEVDGVEPTTLCLQSRCSSQLSYTPLFIVILRIAALLLDSLVGHYHQVTPSCGSRAPCASSKQLQNFKVANRVYRASLCSPEQT